MLKGRPYLLRLSEYTHTHAHTHAHTHILLQLRGKAKAGAKANSSQVKQLLFKLDGVDFGNNNNKNIKKYLCVCVIYFVVFVNCMRLAARQIDVTFLPASAADKPRFTQSAHISIIKS